MFAPVIALALSSLLAINAAPISITQRANPPVGWLTKVLEPYDQYHTRYLAINCQDKHDTQFFDDCCHPMLASESLQKNRKAYCAPSAVSSSSVAPKPTSSAAPKPTPSASEPVDEGDDCDDEEEDVPADEEDCDDDEDDEPAPAPSSTKAPQSSADPKPTSTHAPSTTAKPTETPKPSTTKASSSAKPTETASSDNGDDSGLSEIFKGGEATFYEQNGVAGACGTVHGDDDLIVAMDYRFYGNTGKKSEFCGRKVVITNTDNGKSITATVADACPTCKNKNSLDLSHAAFNAIGKPETGVLPIAWHFA